MSFIELREISKSYILGDTRVQALQGINLKLEKSEFAALIGASGSGKSTLLHILGSIDHPDSGTHFLDGLEIPLLNDDDKSLIRNQKIGNYISKSLAGIQGITEVRGRGLMIGIELDQPVGPVRDALLYKEHIFCGYAGKSTLRLLPSLAMDQQIADRFLESLAIVLRG